MRKNKMLRMASALLMLVLLTTSVVGGTFAKYVTTADASDTARVAKWGVKITATGETFKTEYAQDDTSYTITGKKTVKVGSGTDKLVAPGTSGDMAKMTLTGTPEVAVRVNYTGAFDISENWKDKEGEFYCPLIITLSKGATTNIIDGSKYATEAAFEEAVNKAIQENYQAVYAPGTDLSQKNDDSLSVHWEWPFYSNDANDVKDTYLGDQAAATPDNAATVTVAVTTTVTQIN